MQYSSLVNNTENDKLRLRLLIILGILSVVGMALYIYTSLLPALALPFLGLIAYWLFQDLKSFYWFFILTIPFSVQIHLMGDFLSITLSDEPIMWVFVSVTGLLCLDNKTFLPECYD